MQAHRRHQREPGAPLEVRFRAGVDALLTDWRRLKDENDRLKKRLAKAERRKKS